MSDTSDRQAEVAYRLLNAAIHARTSPGLIAPSMVCFLAIWCDRPFDKESRDNWRAKVDEAVALTLLKLRENIVDSNSYADNLIIYFTRYAHKDTPTSLIKPQQGSLDSLANYLLSADLRAITLAVDLDEGRLEIRFELHSEYCSVAHFFTPGSEAGICSKLNDLRETCALPNPDADDAEKIGKYFYETFWQTILSGLPFFEASTDLTNDLGFLFADFRGLIISDETVPMPCDIPTSKVPTWGEIAANKLKPFIGATSETVVTASYMLDGRVFYMTTLAPPEIKSANEIRRPLSFIMYVHHHAPGDPAREMVNPQQLGRLIDRLLLLGTVRLAALTDLVKMRAAGRILANFEPETRQARIELDRGNEYESDAVISKFNDDIDSLEISGGLEYRVERSRYYVEQFNNALDGLRLVRVEGYQPYDKFVRQKLGARFDFIDRLGRRYERALNSTFRLVQANLSLNVTNIQRVGEAIIFMGLLPYYVYSLIEHATERHSWKIACATWAILFGIGAYRIAQYSKSIQSAIRIPNIRSARFIFIRRLMAKMLIVAAASTIALIFYYVLVNLHAPQPEQKCGPLTGAECGQSM